MPLQAVPGTTQLVKLLQEFILTQLLFQDQESDLELDTSLIQEGIIDSVGVLELVNHISSTYGVEIQPEEVIPENFDSIRRLAAFIERKRSGRAPHPSSSM